jgi:hypothetical protein
MDRNGRIAARRGWTDQTTNAIASNPNIDQMVEFLLEDGTVVMVSASGTKVFKDIDDFTDTGNDITSSSAPSDDAWTMISFNNKLLSYNVGETATTWANSGDISDQSVGSGAIPTGDVIHAAFGRIWGMDSDGQTLKFCGLLTELKWAAADGGGSIDMSSIWTNGMDSVVAISSVGSTLVVFGKKHIVMWADGSGSEIGLSPSRMKIVDIIEGTGCIARQSVQVLGEGDIAFLSRNGVQLLSRVITEKSNPVKTITKYVRKDVITLIDADTMANLRSCYSPEEGMYLLTFPASDQLLYLSIKDIYQDEEGDTVAPAAIWRMDPVPRAMVVRENGDILFAFNGVVGKYLGNTDDGTAYSLSFKTGWIDPVDQATNRNKILKEITWWVSTGSNSTVVFNWGFDFSEEVFSKSIAYTGGTGAEWNVAEWGTAEWSGSITLEKRRFPGLGEGQYIRLGLTASISSDFVIQQIQIAPKVARMVV